MRLKMICVAIWVAASVCGNAQTNDPVKADVAEFRRLISTGSNGEIGKAMLAFFQTNAPASRYEAIIPLANESKARDYGRKYFFWFRNRDPKQEGDYWVEVMVDETSKTIKGVQINGYIK